MLSFVFIIIIIITVCILSSILIYLLLHSRVNSKLSSAIHEKQKLKYSIYPSIDIIKKRLPSQFSISSRRCSSVFNPNDIKLNPTRSYSLANNFIYNKTTNRRLSSIFDSKQISQIEFSLPLTPEKYRRQSEPVCNNLNEINQNTIKSIIKTIKLSNQPSPCLVSFSIIYLKSSQIKICFHSLTSLPSTIQLQQLIIKVKLIPDGKSKYIEIKKILDNEKIFSDSNNDYSVQFSNISLLKLNEKSIMMKFHGKDQTNKKIHLGQVGKIHFNQIKDLQNENPLDFIHEIENIKLSSMEIYVILERSDDHNLIVDIQRIKGIKIDQKNTTGSCFFQVILLDRHRPLSTHQTKSYRLNSSTISLNNSINLNILAFNPNNLDRIMIMINFYSTSNQTYEHQCVGRVKLASPFYCSGTGAIHWEQFKERQSFSMWHTLIKQ